jgi:hypothetical protein
MSISEIDKKILEYKVKMERKTTRETRGRKQRWSGIPVHLRKFYEDEIEKLEKQKIVLSNQKIHQATIDWKKIKFENHQIRIIINGHFSEPFPFSDSRDSYEFLKTYILKADLKPLSFSIFGNKIVSVESSNELNTVIQILSVQNEINCYFNDFESTTIDKILSKLNIISNQHLFDFFKLKQRSSFLSLLCEQQSTEYRIIPTTEILLSNDKTVSEEDTFLFTIKTSSKVYIVWESTVINKATYIFQTSGSSYPNDIQNLFDFIASKQNYKRRKLRHAIKTKGNPFKSIGVIQHLNTDTWKEKLKNILQT